MSVWTMACAADPALRLQHPNSKERRLLLIALDQASEQYGDAMSSAAGGDFTFFCAGGGGLMHEWTAAIDSRGFDIVMVVATDLIDPAVIDQIGQSCADNHVTMSAALVQPADDGAAAFQTNLSNIRRWAASISLLEEADDVPAMLEVLGARRPSAPAADKVLV